MYVYAKILVAKYAKVSIEQKRFHRFILQFQSNTVYVAYTEYGIERTPTRVLGISEHALENVNYVSRQGCYEGWFRH